MPIRILAAGDIHIGQRVSGLPSGEPAYPARDAWMRMVDWSIETGVDIIALSGDIIDRDNRFFEAIGALQSGFAKLRENGIQVFMISGNHDFDVLPQIAKAGHFPNVTLLGAGGTWESKLYEKGNESVMFTGWSFPSQYIYEDPLDTFSFAPTGHTIPCIGMLHGEADTPGSRYAPLKSVKMENFPLDCWILGHIHKPTVLNESPLIFYPGSPVAFSPKETGLHSPVLLTVRDGMVQKHENVINSPVRFELIEADVSGSETEEDLRINLHRQIADNNIRLLPELSGVSHLVYDIDLVGQASDIIRIESWSSRLSEDYRTETASSTTVSVRKLNMKASPGIGNLQDLAKQDTPAGLLANTIIVLNEGRDTPFLRNMLEEWKEKQNRLNNRDTFLPLNIMRTDAKALEELGRQYILGESTRLLTELLKQKGN